MLVKSSGPVNMVRKYVPWSGKVKTVAQETCQRNMFLGVVRLKQWPRKHGKEIYSLEW